MANLPEKTEIKKAITDYCQQKGISKNALAGQIGISAATVSNILNDKWASIDGSMWLRIWNYVRPLNIPKLFSTGDFNAVTNLCQIARDHHLMAGLISDYGMGKTTALKAYARNENVYYIYYEPSMRPVHFFRQLHGILGQSRDGNLYDLMNGACDLLNTQENPLVIIDEASKMPDNILMYLHVMRDKTKDNAGIVLGGMNYFKSNLIKKAGKQKMGIPEFLSRIMIWNELNGLSASEVEFICQSHGINDKKVIARLKAYRKFRDLENQILLYNQITL